MTPEQAAACARIVREIGSHTATSVLHAPSTDTHCPYCGASAWFDGEPADWHVEHEPWCLWVAARQLVEAGAV